MTTNHLAILVLMAGSLLAKEQAIAHDPKKIDWDPVDIHRLKEQDWRKESATGFGAAYPDLDGNGVEDEAMLVVSKDGLRSAIRVCLRSSDTAKPDACTILAEGENIHSVMGLDKRDPGCYEYFENEDGTLAGAPVCTRSDVLEYFRFGSSGSIFVYDKDSKLINRYWDSY